MGFPFDADAILDDGRLVKHCEHKVPHTVGHLDPKLMGWPSVTIHKCDGCCAGWHKMSEEHEWPRWRNPVSGVEHQGSRASASKG